MSSSTEPLYLEIRSLELSMNQDHQIKKLMIIIEASVENIQKHLYTNLKPGYKPSLI